MSLRADATTRVVLRSGAPFLAGALLLACGVWNAVPLLGLARWTRGPLGSDSLTVALLIGGAGAAVVFAAWDLFWLRRQASQARAKAHRASAERDLALLQARRMRAQAEGLALMREIHRSTAIAERHDRLHRILTLVGDLFEAREVALLAAGAGRPFGVLPVAYLRSSHQEEAFVAFDPEAFMRAMEAAKRMTLRMPKVAEATRESVGCWLCLEGKLAIADQVVARAQGRLLLAGGENGAAERNPAEVLEELLAHLDFSPGACRQAAAALEQRRTLRHRESAKLAHAEAGEDVLVLNVPLLADQRPVGVLRIRRQAEGFDGPAAEALEEMLLESAKHIALAMKKDEDDLKAITDQLTGLFIKRHFLEVLERLRGQAAGTGQGFALLLCDLDHFKQINDTHGHLSGDHILKGVAQVLRATLRAGDLAFRYGGEELAILMPGASPAAAKRTAERLRAAVERGTFAGDAGQTIPVTLSVGVTLHQNGLSSDQLISHADQALYESKRSGRNRVSAWRGAPNSGE